MTESTYAAVHEAAESKHGICVSRMLKLLGVSKSGYYAWLNRVPSNRSLLRERVKAAVSYTHLTLPTKA